MARLSWMEEHSIEPANDSAKSFSFLYLMPESNLSWRIPTSGDPRLLRLALAQVGLATIVAALVLLVAAPRDWLIPALVGLIPLAVLMAFRRWSAYQRSMAGSDNVWIDAAGVHWLDSDGQQRIFGRSEVLGFAIGHDEDTLRSVPSLTLDLAGGFESQPIEVHPPATAEAVREVLSETWNVAERESGSRKSAADYDVAFYVYSECHEDFQEWHWEGTREELIRFFEAVAAAADELPDAPVGAKPVERIVLASRREPTRLRIARAASIRLTSDMIAAPAGVLKRIAALAAEALSDGGAPDAKFEVLLAERNRWTFHLHVTSG